jgi:serine/threonine protein kinase
VSSVGPIKRAIRNLLEKAIRVWFADDRMPGVRELAGQTFRGWRITRELGRGDSAIVYEAVDGARKAAIKFFFPEALSKHGFSEETQRLELQLQLRGKKHHPNLVEIYGGGVAEELGGTLFIVMVTCSPI